MRRLVLDPLALHAPAGPGVPSRPHPDVDSFVRNPTFRRTCRRPPGHPGTCRELARATRGRARCPGSDARTHLFGIGTAPVGHSTAHNAHRTLQLRSPPGRDKYTRCGRTWQTGRTRASTRQSPTQQRSSAPGRPLVSFPRPRRRQIVRAARLHSGHHHVPEGRRGRPAAGHGHPHQRRRRGRLLPGGRRDRGVRGAGAGGARRRLVHRALRLLRRLQQLLRDVPVPVHHVRADRGDHRPGVHVVRHQRRAVHAHHAAHRLPVRLLLLLPRQDARPVRPPGEPLRRLLRPLLLRVLRALPGVPGAQEARLRHEHGVARQHGEAGPHRRHHAAADAPGDDTLNDACCCRSQVAARLNVLRKPNSVSIGPRCSTSLVVLSLHAHVCNYRYLV